MANCIRAIYIEGFDCFIYLRFVFYILNPEKICLIFTTLLVFQEFNHQIFADWSNFMNKSVKIIALYHPFRLALDFSITFMGRRSVVLCGHSRAVGRYENPGGWGEGASSNMVGII